MLCGWSGGNPEVLFDETSGPILFQDPTSSPLPEERLLICVQTNFTVTGDEPMVSWARITTKLSTQVPLSSVLRAPPKSAAHYRSTALPLQPFAMTDQALKVYRGNCHCKSYIFEAKLPEIKTVYGCNCSLCVRKATLYYIIPGPADLTWVKGNETSMNNYMFGPKTFNHKSCSTCGTSLVSHGLPQPDGVEKPDYGVNVRVIQDIDLRGLSVEVFDGAATPPPYQPPTFTGKKPQPEVQGGQLVTGNCHCGGVRLAIKTKPLHEIKDLLECNCSICSRYGATWGFFEDEQVAFEGEGNLTPYQPPCSGVGSMRFCKICGVPISNAETQLQEGKVDRSTDEDTTSHHHKRGKVGINLNVLNEIDLKQLYSAYAL